MPFTCPGCGSARVRYSQRKSLWEGVLAIIGYCHVRCQDCGQRYSKGIAWLPGAGYARCPRCLRDDLTDWEEKYYYPPRWQQALLNVGAKAHRCAVCRVNFVSFRRRRAEFVPSWKQKPQPPKPPADTQPGASAGSKENEKTVA